MTGFGGLIAGIIVSVVFSLVYVWLVWILDRYEKEPLPIVAMAWGGGLVVAPLLTAIIEAVSGIPNSLAPVSFQSMPGAPPNLAGAVVDEMAKALVLWLIFRLQPYEFDDMLDGIVYGAVVGAGYSLAESLLYLKDMFAFAQSVEFSLTFFAGLFLSGLTHCAFTAVVGLCLGYSRELGWHNPWVATVGWVAAAIYHAGFVGLGYLAVHPTTDPALALLAGGVRWLIQFAGIAILVVMAFWAWGRQRAVLRTHLTGETEAITPVELDGLVTRGRMPAQLDALRASGTAEWRRVRRLQQAQVELAFAKQRAAQGRGAAGEVDECRQQIRQLRTGHGA